MSRASIRFSGVPRLLRGAVLGTAVLLITLAGHAAGYSGNTPDLAPFVVLLPLAVMLGSAIADRRLSALALVGFVLGSQMLMHTVLTVGFAHPAHSGAVPTVVPGPKMLIGHAIASILVLLVLVYGEDVLHRWLRFVADLTRTWTLTFAPMLDGATAPWARISEPLVTREFAESVQRRGPPPSA